MDQRHRAALKLCLVTDGRGELAPLLDLAQQAIEAGVRAVQLREPQLSARQVASLAERLLPQLDAVGGILLVNDRVDVVAAGLAHGAHVGHRSLPPQLARAALRPGQLLACAVHEPWELAAAHGDGCDFGVLGPVLATSSKPGVAPIGLERAGEWTAASPLPLLWLGGFDADTIAGLAAVPPAQRPLGIAVRSAICAAPDAGAAAWRLLQELKRAGW